MIAGGESFYKKTKILNWINKKAIDIFHPDSNVFPISELYKISNKLIIKDIQVIPHNWCNMVSSASNFHFANSNNNIKYIEYNIIKNFYKNIFTYKFSYKNNSFDFSLAPGLGVDLTKSKELLKNMSYEKKR
jgi:L-alanine-DL-glutamate epimerase-like enolase superfamily enzyme